MAPHFGAHSWSTKVARTGPELRITPVVARLLARFAPLLLVDILAGRVTILGVMLPHRSIVARTLLFGVGLLLGGCRSLNPEFADSESGSGAQDSAEDPRQDSSSALSTSGPGESLSGESAGATSQDRSTQDVDSSSLSQGSTDSPSTSDDAMASTDSPATTTSSTTSTDTAQLPASPRWTSQGTTVKATSFEDHCKKGATSCFILNQQSGLEIASGTPGHEDIKLSVSSPLAPASGYDTFVSPTGGGLGFNGGTSRLETVGDLPIYKGQDFGIELWYRRAPNHGFTKNMILMHLHQNIRIEEWPDGGLSCYMPTDTGGVEQQQHAFKPASGQMDILRHVVCFVQNNHVHLMINGKLQSNGPTTGSPRSFLVTQDRPTGKMALGNWISSNKNGPLAYTSFKGTIYLARTWNNITKMKDALMQELPKHGLSTADLGDYRP